ncbi:hypothetical protein CQ040_20380 [Microbacterium sp. MYb54]|uniref:hypothetical protein n=1 Tax=Microbacterium sp. MYb54 TaxID=1848689 RepID=UPI000CFF2466|nr:hypothetical protein [Microbacterium sp. MYb54]PRB13310.1 hypothetical protein CQ040_20380 [Microbacterium sp. MYb54]
MVRTYDVQEVVEVGRRGVEGRAAHMSGMDEKTDVVVAWFGRLERVVLRVLVVAWGVWSVCTGEPVGAEGLVELLGALRGGG